MRVLRNPREPLAFAVLVLLGFVVARFVSVAVHEVLGHGLASLAMGGSFYGVYVSPGSGFALVYVPLAAPAAATVLVALAGIGIEIVLGVGIFLAYPRIRTFLGRLFALLLMQVLLVYSFLYLALGAADATGGDSAAAVVALEAPHLTWAFVAVGLLWGTALAILVSRMAVDLVAPTDSLRRQVLYLVLFWFAPLAVGAFPVLALLATIPFTLIVYVALFAVVGSAMFGAAVYLASRRGRKEAPRDAERPVGHVAPLAIAFLLVLPAWIVPFGLTDGTAHGLLLQEPPLEAERQWAVPIAINVRADLATDGNVTLVFTMKGVPPPGSPLEQRVVASYESRADFAYWGLVARTLARGATNATSWNVTSEEIDTQSFVWVDGREVANPRVVAVGITLPEDLPSLTNVTTNGTATFRKLTVFDPFQYRPLLGCPECFLDAVNLTWPSGSGMPGSDPFRLDALDVEGGSPEQLVGFDAATNRNFVRFRVLDVENAATWYAVVLEVL